MHHSKGTCKSKDGGSGTIKRAIDEKRKAQEEVVMVLVCLEASGCSLPPTELMFAST